MIGIVSISCRNYLDGCCLQGVGILAYCVVKVSSSSLSSSRTCPSISSKAILPRAVDVRDVVEKETFVALHRAVIRVAAENH